MIITCPKCDVRYALSAEALGNEGRKLKCSKCGHHWFQTPAEDLPQKIEKSQESVLQPADTHKVNKVFAILHWIPNGWVVFLTVLILTFLTLFVARFPISTALPGTIPIYETFGVQVAPLGYGLKIAEVVSKPEIEDDNKLYFTVSGYIVNLTNEVKDIPKLECKLYDIDGKELHSWTFVAEKNIVNAQSQVSFSSRIENKFLESKGFQIVFSY